MAMRTATWARGDDISVGFSEDVSSVVDGDEGNAGGLDGGTEDVGKTGASRGLDLLHGGRRREESHGRR